MYFGQANLVRAVDERLAEQGLGRAHHRALYFIARQPDLTVSELLRFLNVTKQSLGRVLGELVDRNLVEMRTGRNDRRQRLLRLTPDGATFEAALFDNMRERLSAAYAEAGQGSVTGFWMVLEGLLSPDERARVAALRSR